MRQFDKGYYNFAKSLEKRIESYGYDKEDRTEIQERQVEELVSLERKYRDTLVSANLRDAVYGAFVDHIVEERRNILTARPFFRERQRRFDKKISDAIRNKDYELLARMRINYQFILFCQSLEEVQKSDVADELSRIFERIKKLREEIVEINLPLAISRARIFFGKTPASHHNFMDFIQIASEGLIAAVDKFVPPFKTVFRAVAIGRMLGNFIFEYNKTALHFYPSDRRKLYHANRAARMYGKDDFDSIARYVNERIGEGETTSTEIQYLMSGASTVSSDVPFDTDDDSDGEIPINTFAAPDSDRPDKKVENAEALSLLAQAIDQLTLFEKKLLLLKGVNIHE